jgi:quercetin dioxygenase-like cupin family protein
MSLTFIKTTDLPRVHTPQGDVTEVLNKHLCGAENVLGMLRWLKTGEAVKVEADSKHQLVYLMEGEGTIQLEGKDYPVKKGAGVYLGPNETATVSASNGALKLFHLVVPQIPK